MRRSPAVVLHVMLLLALSSCEGPDAKGLKLALKSSGPRVVFDLDAKPLPEIPLPNDLATRYDPTSPTGRRVNVTEDAPTEAERSLRRNVNTLDGFGVYQPITVSFEAPLDLENIHDRMARNHDLADDPVYLLNIDRDSEGFGEAIRLDAGQGNYPLGMEWPQQYWDFDEHADSLNLVFETHDEDKNGNGVLDPYEDIDFDGVLDKPNTWSGEPTGLITPDNIHDWLARDDRPADDLITFYEKETNTLVLWPVVPLREATTYAVVLMDDLTDPGGQPVRSPFKYINHLRQNEALAPLAGILRGEGLGRSLSEVVFAWSFTTQTVGRDLEAIRAGLYGHGPFAELAAAYPPDITGKPVHGHNEDGSPSEHPYVLYFENLGPLIDLVAEPVLEYSKETSKALSYESEFIDYFVLGSFRGPSLLVDSDGIATDMYPAEDDEVFRLDHDAGTIAHGPQDVDFICSIPETTAEHKPPFPVVLYGHGFSGASFETFGFGGRFAQFGYALCGLEAPGHGMALPSDEAIDYAALIKDMLAMMPMDLLTFYSSYETGRIVDLDNDGKRTSFDNGGDFWSWDLFHMRDMTRQSTVDHMHFIRTLRSLGEVTWDMDVDQDGEADDLMGDWNGDGVIDIGGPGNNSYPVWGQSMGGTMAMLLAGTEGCVDAATPVSGATALLHVGLRSTNPGVPEAVFMPLFGPFVVFTPQGDDDDTVEVAFMINHLHRENRPEQVPRPHYYPMLRTAEIAPGDRVIIRNLDNGEEVKAFRHEDGAGFRVSLQCDAVSAVEKRPLLGLQDGDTLPVPVSCAPGTWTVAPGDGEETVDAVVCDDPDLARSALFGDRLQIEVLDGWDGPTKVVFDTFGMQAEYEGAIFPEGAPLVALGTGLGRARNTPELRKLLGFASMIVTRGDPLSYARYLQRGQRLDFSYDPGAAEQANMIVYHTIGDPNVPLVTATTQARALGVLDYLPGQLREVPKNDRLIQGSVIEGVEGFWRYQSTLWDLLDWQDNESGLLVDMRWPTELVPFIEMDPSLMMPLHSDPDDLDGGVNEFGETTVAGPVRATAVWDEATGTMVPVEMPSSGDLQSAGGIMALRLPYYSPMGAHGVEPSNPSREFNINNFVENQIAVFMTSGGTRLVDDPCLEDASCDFLPETLREIYKNLK
jgi:hypothetical protein